LHSLEIPHPHSQDNTSIKVHGVEEQHALVQYCLTALHLVFLDICWISWNVTMDYRPARPISIARKWRLLGGGCRMMPEGRKSRPKAESEDWVLGEGQ